MEEAKATTVALVFERPLTDELISERLSAEADLALIEHLPTAQLQAESTSLHADVILLETTSDHRATTAMVQQLRFNRDAEIVALGVRQHRDALQIIEAGASSYVLSSDSFSDLLRWIRAAKAGQVRCEPSLASTLCRRIAELQQQVQPKAMRRDTRFEEAGLTPRQNDVLRLMAMGLSNKEIAEKLSISTPTVKNHVHRILEKLQVTRRREAARLGFESGLVQGTPTQCAPRWAHSSAA